MKTKIIQVGSSKGMIIPTQALKEIGLEKGDFVNLTLINKTLTITKVIHPHAEFEKFIIDNPQCIKREDWTW